MLLRFGAISPVKGLSEPRLAFGELQEKAKVILNTSSGGVTGAVVESGSSATANSAQLLQFIEDFCREGDRVVDENKRDKVDLQKQVRMGAINIINWYFMKHVIGRLVNLN